MLTLAQLPLRNRGTYLDKCQKVKLTTNLFKVDFKPNTNIYIFSVKTLPNISFDNGKKLRTILMANRVTIQKLIGQYVISGRTLYGTKFQSNGKIDEFNIRAEFENITYQIFLKKVKQFNMSDINSSQKHQSGSVYSFLNNMMRNFFHQHQFTQIGKSRKYFDPHNRINIQNANITIFKGYSSSFSLLQNGLHLKIDPAMKIIRSETVLDIINKVYNLNSSRSKSQKRLLVEEEIIGKTVMANYGKNQYYIIQSVQFDLNIDTYTFNNGTKVVNLLEYYKETYDINISSKKQPLVKAASSSKKKDSKDKIQIILIPQLLFMSGLPDDFDQRKRMQISQATIVSPNDKYADIENIFKIFNSNSSSTFNPKTIEQNLGIKIQSKPTTITAKQLSYPTLQLGGKQAIQQNKACNFMLFNKALYNHNVELKATVFVPNDFDFNGIKSLFSSTCTNLGLTQSLNIEQINFKDFKNVLKNIQGIVTKTSANGTANVYWFIIPPNFKTQYKSIKRLCLKTGIQKVSQVCVTSTLQKKGMASILTKILLQMAAKVGNKLWVPKVSQKLQNSGVLLIGTQVTKDSQNKQMNVISFCSNVNKQFSAFYSNYIHQNKKQDRSNMKIIIYECLNEYLQKNGSAPSELILMKNGSSKIDQKIHIQAQINQIKEILNAGSKDYAPVQLTYLIVDKDTSLKLFSDRGNNLGNPNSGILINSEAVGKGQQFYLVAQQSNRGTIKPTFYKTIYSDSKLQEGFFQELIYSQCFNYMNWSGAIKIPSVMQYAKKLGAFIGQYINKQNSFNKMNKSLYFI